MNQTKDLSSFGQYAVALDTDFTEIERLAGQVERLEIESDAGIEHGVKLLSKFSDCGQRVAEGVQLMAKELEACRLRAEKAAQLVSARALLIQARHEKTQTLLAKFQTLGDRVRDVTAAVGQLKKPDLNATLFADFDAQLSGLIEQMCQVRDEAHSHNMKNLERNAHALGQTLESARQRLKSFVQVV